MEQALAQPKGLQCGEVVGSDLSAVWESPVIPEKSTKNSPSTVGGNSFSKRLPATEWFRPGSNQRAFCEFFACRKSTDISIICTCFKGKINRLLTLDLS